MSDFLDRISKLSPKRLALLALELHEAAAAAGRQDREPIAVIGMACRFPGGADDPEAFWGLLSNGRDAIREVPGDRWDIDSFYDPDPDAPGRMSTRSGGFLGRIDGFDPAFFGIAPREALTMDPQQRLLLEVAWEALEHAGLAPERLAGSATGVYFGVCNGDHFQRVLARGAGEIDAYLASGNAHSVAAGRISYFLGLQGPALAIDTACSSSLVALHVACRSLRAGETRMALAGGVNVMCSPETTIALSKSHMLAPDGRCKTFDAAADGFSRGEGCGVLVLKRLSDATADGDRILALIRGTAANQDGRSGGLTVPNGPAQEAVIRAALADADVSPSDIGYVEAHGTGTALGDPIEVRALAGALGPGRPADDPLVIGSVKTNIGHLESAAGVAGVIKVILSLQHERIPPHLHFRTPSPHISWAEYPVTVLAGGCAWPRGARPRLAGVSSFGFSGTNAHVILEEAPRPEEPRSVSDRPLHCLALSARTDAALRRLAGLYAHALTPGTGPTLADTAHTAGIGRSHFSERLAIVARDADEARAALTAFAAGDPHPAAHRGTAVPGSAPEVVFLFTGQGAQYPGMGRLLYETSPVFRDVIDRCDALLGPDQAGRTLLTVLGAAPAENAPIHETAWTQPALFAVEYALTQVWRSWGIEPAAVIGHSVGEYVAACVAGVFTLEDGLRLIAERGRLMQALPPGGAMAALFTPGDEVAAAVAPLADRLAIAAINAPDSVVVSGDAAAVDKLLAGFAQRNVQGKRLFISLAAHSPLVEPALDAMESCARTVPMRAPRIPVAWNLTGGVPLSAAAPDATYWRRHLREPVRFGDGITTLYREGYRTFLEVGPHPTLIALSQRSLPEAGTLFLASLRRGKDDWHEMTTSLAELYCHGAPVDWAGVDRPYARRRVSLPSYPFERRSFWIQPSGSEPRRLPTPGSGANPLLGGRIPTAVTIFETVLTPDAVPYLADHRLNGAVLVAGPVFLEMAQAAAHEALGPAIRAVEAFVISEPLVLPDAGRIVQVNLGETGNNRVPFSIHSRPTEGTGEWLLHVTGRLVACTGAPEFEGADRTPVATLEPEFGPSSSCEGYYDRLAGLGIQLGPSFRSLREARQRAGEVLAAIVLPPERAGDLVTWIHPALLDGALQAVGLAVPASSDTGDLYLLTAVERFEVAGALPSDLRCHARILNAGALRPSEWRADVTLLAPGGGVVGVIRGVCLRRASREALARAGGAAPAAGLFYRVAWEPAPAAKSAAASFDEPGRFVPRIRERFSSLASVNDLSVYEQLLPELDRLCSGHVAAALRQLGFDATVGRVFTARAEAGRLGVAARHAKLFARLLDILAEDGVLKPRHDGFEVVGALAAPDPEVRYEALLARFAATDGELRTLRRCGGELARVLRGEQDPLQLLFPGGSFSEARKLYIESPYARTYNAALGETLQAAVAALPDGARLRVLEIGGGTGGTTSFVLPLLPAARTEYTFTDLSPLFLERAAEQFAAYAFLRRALLDIERDPLEQGFEAGRYDVVIAANVLHATADLRQALEHARLLLASGGLLLLLEGVAPERWVDLTFGLTEGWWRFTDSALRPHYPLVARQTWLDLLADLGFTGGATIPDASWSARGGAQQALVFARAPVRHRRWALIGAQGGVGTALAGLLRERGDEVTQLPAEAPEGSVGSTDEVVYLGALDLATRPAADASAVRSAEALSCEMPLRWLARCARREESCRVWLVTQGAQPAAGRMSAGARWQAPLWGVGRVFALEQPGRWGGLIDLPPGDPTEAVAETLRVALDADDGEDQTAWRAGSRFSARLFPAPTPDAPPIGFRPDATYLVTGGFGGLGLIVARWLAERGARNLALLGRHPDPASEGVRAIEALGARVLPLAGDVADEAAMTALLGRLRVEAPPLRGVMHAAADLGVAPIGELMPAQVSSMLRPKVDGTVVLERLTQTLDLDFLVLFSSTTALLGASGFAHYAAANAFLDASAQCTNRPGRHVLSVNWGTWEAMRMASADSQRSFRASGLEPLSADEALRALGQLLGGTEPQAVVARIDWSVLKPLHEARRPRPFLSHLGIIPAPAGRETPAVSAPGLIERLAAAPAGTRQELLLDFVGREVAAVLGLDGSEPVPPETGLFDLGMDSLMSVELKRRLEQGAGRPLPSTLTFNYPNVAALARFLDSELSSAAPEAIAEPRAPAAPGGGDLGALSDAELEARLLRRLEQTR